MRPIRLCNVCGAMRVESRLAPYFPEGSNRKHWACESPACREHARAEIRCDVVRARAA